jgi:two-component system, cell cycle sensor histidine kinase and response regulator CckA
MSDLLRVLMVEDLATDAKLVARELGRAGHQVEFERVEDAAAMRAALARRRWDLIISDSSMPHFSAEAALAVLKETRQDIPFIIVSGTIGDELAVQAMRAGANDFVLKDKLGRLAPAVERELRDQKVRESRRQSQAGHAAILEAALDAIIGMDHAGNITEFSPAAEKTFGYSRDEVLGKPLADVLVPPALREAHRKGLARYLATGQGPVIGKRIEMSAVRRDGSEFPVELAITRLRSDGPASFIGFVRDITARKQAEERLQRAEEQLRQGQKMEAVGQLAGGIAHDFNNMLAVVLSSSSFLLEGLSASDPRREDAEEIKLAAERAASLTRQLLAFSRKQALGPRVIDLHSVIAGLEKMLHRLIGEEIELTTVYAAGLGRVKADPGQIEQVILNLVLNARDAMPGGGKLRIETADVQLDSVHASEQATVPPGSYVLVTVSDSGVGMDAETQRRIFEPFFTTKEKSKGTGLGLSTCYGIVKQSGGHIRLTSEPGRGSAFKIHLPRIDEEVELIAERKAPHDLSGAEIVLVVEDDDRVRAVVKKILDSKGYHVLAVRDATEAIAVADQYPKAIDLVLTDVVMPGLSGPDLTKSLLLRRPQLKLLYMSGYMDHSLLENAAVDPARNFLPKPFTPEILASKVREILDA